MQTSNKKLISGTLERQMLALIPEYKTIKSRTNIHFKTIKD